MTINIRDYLEIRTAAPGNFSPDGTKLLISSNLPGTSQVYRLDTTSADRELVQLTDDNEPVGGAYLPTTEQLLLARDHGGNERHQLYRADDEPGAERADLVVDPDYIHTPGGVTRDGRHLAYGTNRRNGTDFDVWVRELATGDERMVYAPGSWASPSGFSPNGTFLTVGELTERSGDNKTKLVRLADDAVIEVAPHDDEPAQVSSLAWLPDESAAFFSTNIGRDQSAIARFDPASGDWEYVLTDDRWGLGVTIDWTGTHLLVVANEDGYTRAHLHDPQTLARKAELPLPGNGVAAGFSFSKDGRYLAYAFTSSLVPGDTWRYDTATGTSERLTTSPCGVDPATFVEPELVRFTSFDGLEVPAYVFRPRDPGPGKLPVVINIHGGPESQYRPSFSPLTQYLVAQGFAVIAPNVRGSTGYGKIYEHLDDQRKRLDSVADLGGLHDWIATTTDLDPDRCALYGGSYGGYMVLCGLTMQPERWAAGVNIVGMSSLVTFLENTSDYRRRFREREYGFLEHDRDFLVEASPITHIDNLRAPLFIIHGANDPRVPLSEAEQIHATLSNKGIKAELLVYQDEGHGLAKLANRVDAYPQVADFLKETLGVAST